MMEIIKRWDVILNGTPNNAISAAILVLAEEVAKLRELMEEDRRPLPRLGGKPV